MIKRSNAVTVITVLAGLGLLLGLCAEGFAAAPGNSRAGADARAGRDYATHLCADCHDVSSRVDDQFARTKPPSFYVIANAKTTTAMGLNVFLVSTHAPMPNFILTEQERQNVIAYILTLRDEKSPHL